MGTFDDGAVVNHSRSRAYMAAAVRLVIASLIIAKLLCSEHFEKLLLMIHKSCITLRTLNYGN